MIRSINNLQIKNLIQLQSKAKVRKKQGAFVIEGSKMFEEAKELKLVIKAFVAERFLREKGNNQKHFFDKIEYEVVADAIYDSVSATVTPQGIMAIVRMPCYKLDSLLNHPRTNLLLLEDLRDPGNLGTILRTAEGAGVTGIILSKESVDIFNPKVIRSTMGSIYRMPFIYVEDFMETLFMIKEKGIVLYATHLAGQSYYTEEIYNDKCGIIIGNEAKGITDKTAKIADRLVKIPMEGQVESLNAAIAAAILIYEVYRQRKK